MKYSAFLGPPGLTGVGYQFFDYNEVAIGARTTSGVIDSGSGWYTVNTRTPYNGVSIRWNDTGDTSAIAREYIWNMETMDYSSWGTAQGATTSTITLDALSIPTTGYYNSQIISIVDGKGDGQGRIIESYNGSTRVATVPTPWSVIPDSTSEYIIMPFGAVPGATAPTATEVANTVWNKPRVENTVTGTFGEGVVLSAGAIASIWDALTNALTTVGSIGRKLALFVLGTDNKALITADTHTSGVTVAAATNVTGNVQGSVIGNVQGSVGSFGATATSQLNARTVPSAEYAQQNTLNIVKAKTDLLVNPLRVGQLVSGQLNSVVLEPAASSVINFYRYALIVLTGGTGANQARFISAYTGGAGKIATVSEDFAVQPDSSTTYSIIPASNVLAGPAWQTLITMVSNPAAGTSSVSGFLGADENRTFSVAPAKLHIEGVVGNSIAMPVLFEETILTGYTFAAYVILENGPLEKLYPIAVEPINLEHGLIQVILSDADTRTIGPCANKEWVLEWKSSGGEIRNVTRGRFQLNRF